MAEDAAVEVLKDLSVMTKEAYEALNLLEAESQPPLARVLLVRRVRFALENHELVSNALQGALERAENDA